VNATAVTVAAAVVVVAVAVAVCTGDHSVEINAGSGGGINIIERGSETTSAPAVRVLRAVVATVAMEVAMLIGRAIKVPAAAVGLQYHLPIATCRLGIGFPAISKYSQSAE
jgi:hypothetical protein